MKVSLLPDETIVNKIYLLRDQKVMLDRDLAALYGVETRVLKQAVKRNIGRFPEDFMFEMTKEEFANWRSQFVTSNLDKMGLRYAPFCFTEHGVAMLSSVLSSQKAIDVNIRIIRVFSRMREVILSQKEVLLKLEQIEKKVLNTEGDVSTIFSVLKKLLAQPEPQPRKRIGYKTED